MVSTTSKKFENDIKDVGPESDFTYTFKLDPKTIEMYKKALNENRCGSVKRR